MSTVRSTYSHTRQLCFNIRLRHKDIDKIEDIVKSIRDYLTRKCVLYLCPRYACSKLLQLVQDKSRCLKVFLRNHAISCAMLRLMRKTRSCIPALNSTAACMTWSACAAIWAFSIEHGFGDVSLFAEGSPHRNDSDRIAQGGTAGLWVDSCCSVVWGAGLPWRRAWTLLAQIIRRNVCVVLRTLAKLCSLQV